MAIMILNEGYSSLESRTSKSGKERFTIAVKSEPLIFNTDPKVLGQPIALAIARYYAEKIKGITAIAAPNTLKARKVAAKAFSEGKSWALKRYSGGRTGAMPPNQSDRAFNDSGRSAQTITATASNDGAWRINMAANRLDSSTGKIDRIYRRLVELVPEIANPAMLMSSDIMRRTVESAMAGAVRKANATTSKLRIEAVRGLFQLAENVGSLLTG